MFAGKPTVTKALPRDTHCPFCEGTVRRKSDSPRGGAALTRSRFTFRNDFISWADEKTRTGREDAMVRFSPDADTPGTASDVFERLIRRDSLLTAKELAKLLAVSPETSTATGPEI